jgi:HEAT repeat protein
MKHLFAALLLFVGTAFAQEDKLIAILKSDAPPKEKADACRELAHVGTKEAVPVLAPLLADENLSHMARYALEPIADPSVDAALRSALGKCQGRMLVGVIESLGVRKDTRAVELLAKLLTHPDPAVLQAAARALGKIGPASVPALEKALSSGTTATQPAICEGLFRCAESMRGVDAASIYDKVRKVPNLPHQVQVAALRGAIQSRGTKGVSLLTETIRKESYALAAAAMRISLEMPGQKVTQALAREVAQATPEKQLLLLQTLGYRGDASAVPALKASAQKGPAVRRVAAIRGLAQLRTPATLPLLVQWVKDPEPDVASAAQAGLIGFPGKQADAAIVALLTDSDVKVRVAFMDAAGQRRIAAAVPVLLKGAVDADSAVAAASFKALGEIVEVGGIPGVVDATLRTKALEAAETALSEICSRQPDAASCAEKLLPGLAKSQGEPKLVLLRVLRTVGSPNALTAVRAAATESNAAVQETALRALCDWPTAEALPDLAKMSKTATDNRFKILALRGQLRLIPMQTVTEAQKVSQVRELLPQLERKEEQRLALSTLGSLPCKESLALIQPFLAQEGLKEEAGGAAVDIAEKIVAAHPAEVAKTINQVQTTNKELTERVQKLKALLPKDAAQEGFIPIFNGKDLSGWSSKPGWWTVEDGALTAQSTLEKPCKECNYLIWRGGQPGDFELLADFKLSREGNSGIQIRSEERPDWDTFGYQADMSGDGALVGFVYHHSRGLVAGCGERAAFAADGKKSVETIGAPADLLKHYKLADWNTYRIVCRGPSIDLYINSILMCQITDHHATQAAARGIIALQMHPGPPMKVQFKNIRLKELK